ncbi:DUF1983 domain-containing protein [Escherichia coli]|nr:DUF1983 domain-containing protein [Escherichia coli]
MEDTEEGKLSQFLVAANRIAFIDPANGNETPMFVAQGNQIFMNDVFLKRLTAPTITSGGSPPVFSLTSDGKLTAKNADTHSISGTANSAGAHQHKSSGAFGGTNTSIFPNGYTAISNLSAGIMSTTSGSGQTRNAGKTSSDGAHTHSLSGTAASAGAHAHTVGIGAHTHSVAIGSHGHTITVNAAGNAENTVKNIAFNYIVRLA